VPVKVGEASGAAPVTSATGIDDEAVRPLVPLPLTYPVSVVAPVPPFATGNVLVTCVDKLMPDSVPPRVSEPDAVTVPVRVMPLTVPVPPTEVTVPVLAVAPVATPSNFVLSAALILPAALVVASLMDMAGAVPPELTIGAVPVTPVTVPVFVV
jgi:hypothetical protein